MGESTRGRQVNVDRQAELVRELIASLDETLEVGWFGTIEIKIPVQDGNLQQSTVRTERLKRLLESSRDGAPIRE